MSKPNSWDKLLKFRKSDPWWYVLIVLVLAVILSFSPLISPADVQTVVDGEFSVTRVIDGDTIVVSDQNGEITVRLIGIDTPELAHAGNPVECFAEAAKQQMVELVSGKTVTLESDPTQSDLDKYGRSLRYVLLSDGTNVNLEMIRRGFAHEYTYNVPYIYQTEFRQSEQTAWEGNLGLWGKCGV